MSETTKATSSFLTREAYDRLRAELVTLSGTGRTDIAKRIETARDEGDLKENAGYHAAKEEQGKIEARIRQLQHLLDNSVVGSAPPDDDIVEGGMVISVEMFGDTEEFLLGSREILGNGEDLDVYSEKSPLGQAIVGHTSGDTVTYEAPNGSMIAVKILAAKPYHP